MVNQLSNLISTFNASVASGKRSFLIPNTGLNQRVASLLYSGGYILSYGFDSPRFIRLYPNYAAPTAKLKLPPKTSNRFFTHDQLVSAANSGRSFILYTINGLTLCKFALINKIGGSILLEFKY